MIGSGMESLSSQWKEDKNDTISGNSELNHLKEGTSESHAFVNSCFTSSDYAFYVCLSEDQFS